MPYLTFTSMVQELIVTEQEVERSRARSTGRERTSQKVSCRIRSLAFGDRIQRQTLEENRDLRKVRRMTRYDMSKHRQA